MGKLDTKKYEFRSGVSTVFIKHVEKKRKKLLTH